MGIKERLRWFILMLCVFNTIKRMTTIIIINASIITPYVYLTQFVPV